MLLTAVMATGVTVIIIFAAHTLGILLRNRRRSLAQNVFVGLLGATGVAFASGVAVARGAYLRQLVGSGGVSSTTIVVVLTLFGAGLFVAAAGLSLGRPRSASCGCARGHRGSPSTASTGALEGTNRGLDEGPSRPSAGPTERSAGSIR